jgi:hypothetical protein
MDACCLSEPVPQPRSVDNDGCSRYSWGTLRQGDQARRLICVPIEASRQQGAISVHDNSLRTPGAETLGESRCSRGEHGKEAQ